MWFSVVSGAVKGRSRRQVNAAAASSPSPRLLEPMLRRVPHASRAGNSSPSPSQFPERVKFQPRFSAAHLNIQAPLHRPWAPNGETY
ncbi:hypothetical protein M747DRAFT_116525 [Aspergillus niger ATCC 13496]|uniref:Uncharacterized protein n=1 Tax=Aspergillus niger ATCC 13496 TaxID=1353008 RepID=A0A370CEB9_ASPNG|nr:hypothetical protein M747DRAFT_116525 [Aspergillus niger ATCC 13496]